MSPRTLDSLMHNEAEANPAHLGESVTHGALTHSSTLSHVELDKY